MWRNWQTRRSQKPVMVTSWRFKSSHPHQGNHNLNGESVKQARRFVVCNTGGQYSDTVEKIFVTDFQGPVFSN